jgi:ABC-2 type transport system ATP-binding protein
MRRRLDIACGLIHEPRILFLDEPTTGLDLESRAVLWREVERLASDGGLTILLTTHYLEEVDRLANRLAIVDGGRVVTEGTPDELKRTLRGDRVSVELEDETRGEAAAALLDGLEATTAPPVREGSVVHVQVAEGARAVPAVVSALEAKDLHVVQISLSRPTLDDVYLELTGHSFDHTEKPEPPPSRFGGGRRR